MDQGASRCSSCHAVFQFTGLSIISALSSESSSFNLHLMKTKRYLIRLILVNLVVNYFYDASLAAAEMPAKIQITDIASQIQNKVELNSKHLSIEGKTLKAYTRLFIVRDKARAYKFYYCPIVESGANSTWNLGKPVYIILKTNDKGNCGYGSTDIQETFEGMLRDGNNYSVGFLKRLGDTTQTLFT